MSSAGSAQISERVALIFGGSGISGWAVARELLRYPTPSAFARVTALSNRPLDPAVIQVSDPRLVFAHGVDLTKSVESVVSLLRERVEGVESVTDVFWYGMCSAFEYSIEMLILT